ncbi:MAG: hypothetical protein VW879_15215, partial [Opitutae bacterium]
PTDSEQLSEASWVLSWLLKLDYIPDCISFSFCTETAEHYHLKWSEEAKLHYLESAKQLAKIYWTKRMVKQPKR